MAGTAQKAWLGAATALPSLSGVLVVRKPNGTTSAAVLNRLREKLLAEAGIPHPTRRSRNKILKIGHGGTLDKNASGVLGGQELEQRWKFTSCSTQTADLPTFQSSSSAS